MEIKDDRIWRATIAWGKVHRNIYTCGKLVYHSNSHNAIVAQKMAY